MSGGRVSADKEKAIADWMADIAPELKGLLEPLLQRDGATQGTPPTAGLTASASPDVGSADQTAKGRAVKVRAPNPGSGGATHDASSLTFTVDAFLYVDGQVISKTEVATEGAVDMQSGQTGQLLLIGKMESFEDNVSINQKAAQEFRVSWDINAGDDGKLTIDTPSETLAAPTGDTGLSAIDYNIDTLNPTQGKTFVQISPVVIGAASSGGISVGVGVSKTGAPPKVKETFRVDIRVKVREPKGTVEILPDVTAFSWHEFVFQPFKITSPSELESGSIDQLAALIVGAMSEEIKEAFSNPPDKPKDPNFPEFKLIQIDAYTSNTDVGRRNYDLSKQRATSVKKALNKAGIHNGFFAETRPHGEWDYPSNSGMEGTDDKKKEKESSQWRKVVVKIYYGETFHIE